MYKYLKLIYSTLNSHPILNITIIKISKCNDYSQRFIDGLKRTYSSLLRRMYDFQRFIPRRKCLSVLSWDINRRLVRFLYFRNTFGDENIHNNITMNL